MWEKSLAIRCLAQLEHHLLGPVDEIGNLSRAFLAESRDLLTRADERTQSAHLLDDARVVLDVRRRRDERSELGNLRLAADRVELSSFVELVRERDRIDRLALGPQRQRGSVHLAVALAVEVRRVEDLADGPDRGRREQHRAQHRLLGFEILRRDDRAHPLRRRCRGSCHRCGSQAVGDDGVQFAPDRGRGRAFCRKKGTYVPILSPVPDGPSTGVPELSSRKQPL